jgi:hypothetical protein
MNNHKDDGTFITGLLMAVLVGFAFYAGYMIRDYGFIFKLEQQHSLERR